MGIVDIAKSLENLAKLEPKHFTFHGSPRNAVWIFTYPDNDILTHRTLSSENRITQDDLDDILAVVGAKFYVKPILCDEEYPLGAEVWLGREQSKRFIFINTHQYNKLSAAFFGFDHAVKLLQTERKKVCGLLFRK